MTSYRSLKKIVTRSHPTLLQDMVGAASLTVMLMVGLYLPAFV